MLIAECTGKINGSACETVNRGLKVIGLGWKFNVTGEFHLLPPTPYHLLPFYIFPHSPLEYTCDIRITTTQRCFPYNIFISKLAYIT